jgi:hypothetical protein
VNRVADFLPPVSVTGAARARRPPPPISLPKHVASQTLRRATAPLLAGPPRPPSGHRRPGPAPAATDSSRSSSRLRCILWSSPAPAPSALAVARAAPGCPRRRRRLGASSTRVRSLPSSLSRRIASVTLVWVLDRWAFKQI